MKAGPFQSSGRSVAVAAPPGPLPVREAEKGSEVVPWRWFKSLGGH